jgi:hypothetical protein
MRPVRIIWGRWAPLAAWVAAAGALASALGGCEDRQAPAPTASEDKGAARDEVRAWWEEEREKADVVFEGTVRSIEYARTEHNERGIRVYGPPGMILTHFDPRFIVAVRVDALVKGDPAEGWSGDKVFAIHSPSQDLDCPYEEAAGKRFLFYLTRQKGDAGGRVKFWLHGRPVAGGD